MTLRLKPDKQYCPDPKMKNNMTLYEMAYSMSENEDAQEAFPYLVKYLLFDFFNNYKYDDQLYTDSVIYNILYFLVYNFINREVNSKNVDVFRTKLHRELVNINLDHELLKVINDIKEASVKLSKNTVTDDKHTNSVDSTRTDDLQIKLDSDTTSDLDSTTSNNASNKLKTDTTNDNTKTLNTTDLTTNDLTNTKTLNTSSETERDTTDTTTYGSVSSLTGTNTDNNVQRLVNTDYPQSTVDTSVAGTWTYASGAQDIKQNNDHILNQQDSKTGSDATTGTGTVTQNDTGTVTDAATGTTKLEGTGTINDAATGSIDTQETLSNTSETDSSTNTTVDSTQKNTGTVKTKTDEDFDRDVTTDEVWDNISGLDKNVIQIDIYTKHDNFYKRLMRRFENCFYSVYIDEDRDGYLDPTVDLMSAWK